MLSLCFLAVEPGVARYLEKVEGVLGYQFKDKGHLLRACMHISLAKKFARLSRFSIDNARLSVFGDSILKATVIDILEDTYDIESMVEFHVVMSYLICDYTLIEHAKRLELQKFLGIGGSLTQRPTRRDSDPYKKPLTNFLEAIIGAIFIDGGYTATKQFVRKQIIEPLEPMIAGADFVHDNLAITELSFTLKRAISKFDQFKCFGGFGADGTLNCSRKTALELFKEVRQLAKSQNVRIGPPFKMLKLIW